MAGRYVDGNDRDRLVISAFSNKYVQKNTVNMITFNLEQKDVPHALAMHLTKKLESQSHVQSRHDTQEKIPLPKIGRYEKMS